MPLCHVCAGRCRHSASPSPSFSIAIPAHAAAGVHAVHCKGVTVSSAMLRIDGVLSDPESFRGALRVKATRAGRKPYFLPNGELVSTTTSIERRIPPGKVEIANPAEPLSYDPKKTKGRWRSIPVTVKDVRFTGEYKGGLELGSGGCKVESSSSLSEERKSALSEPHLPREPRRSG